MPNNTLHSPNKSDPKNPPLTALSLFAGVGGFDLGLERAGVRVIAQSEIDPHAASVLRRHWPDVPLVPDVTTVNGADYPADIVTGGFPCQDLSVAGKRSGLAGERSGLFYEIVRIVHEMREATDGKYPRWVVLENVVGAFSSNGGDDFAAVLESLVGGEVRRPPDGWTNAGVAFGPLGSAEWRVLDSQHFGVAQRRRRVFVVYHPGSERAGAVLLEPQGVRGDTPPRVEAREGATRGVEGGAGGSRPAWGFSGEFNAALEVQPTLQHDSPTGGGQKPMVGVPVDTAPTVLASWGHNGDSSPRGDGTDPIVPVAFVAGDYSTGAYEPADKAEALTTSADRTRAAPIAFAAPELAEALTVGANQTTGFNGEAVATPYAVRRLTPKECCRLQGFPDEWTRYAADGTEIADTHRYRMMGNAVTVSVAEWIAHRLKEALS